MKEVKTTNIYHINITYVYHYLISINAGNNEQCLCQTLCVFSDLPWYYGNLPNVKGREAVVHAWNGSKSRILIILTILMWSIICLASMLVSMSKTMKFLIFGQFKTPLVVNAAQHNTTTVYISTLTYEKDTFYLKYIPFQKGITEQRF